MPSDLTDRQARDLRTMLAGIPLAHYVDDDSWHLLRSDRSEPVLKRDAALYRKRGWVERVGFEESVPMEVYTLTRTGRVVAARTPEIPNLDVAGIDEPVPVMMVPVVWSTHEPPGGWEAAYVEVPLTDAYLELMTSRQRLAEYLAAVETDFESVHFEDIDARLLTVTPDSTSSGALSAMASEDVDYAFLSAPLDQVHDAAADIEVHRGWLSMVVGPLSVHWQVEVDPSEDLVDDADGTLMVTTVVLPDEIAAAAREFVDDGRGEHFEDDDEDVEDLAPRDVDRKLN